MTLARCRWILLIAVAVVFGRLLLCDFTWWDDWVTVHQNRHMQSVGLDTFTYYWLNPAGNIYIPLTYNVWGLLALVSAVPADQTGITLNPLTFHAANILVHAGGALAAFGLLRRLTANQTAALLGALLWAVHPVQVESVGWVSGLKDVLSGSLVLTSLLFFVRYRQEKRRGFYAASLAVYVLAMLAKPSAFTMPLLLIVIDRLALATPWKRVATSLIAFGLVTVPIAVVAKLAQPAIDSEAALPLRVLVAFNTIAFYVVKLLAPIHLAFDYGRNIRFLRTQPDLYYAWLLPVGIAAVTAWAYRRGRRAGRPVSPLLAVGLLCFVFAPVHVLGLVRFDFQTISIAADHYLYVAVFGAAVVLAWALTAWPRLVPVAVVLIAAYGARAAWQTQAWQDDEALLANEIAVNPDSWTAYVNRAMRLAKMNDPVGERESLLKAKSIRPDDANTVIGLVAHYLNSQEIEKAHAESRELINIYNRIFLPSIGDPALVYLRLIPLYLDVRRPEEAQRYIDEALSVSPNHPEVLRIVAQIEQRRRAEAMDKAATQRSTPATR